ncbi:MAG TPA: DUF4340 domain-containing protein [Candidatus Binatia bacterium]|nr:DUF4340 domain-containing protein [Candidatus Binatia bacterium]
MTWRNTLLCWLVAAILAGYYVVVERRPAPPSEMQRDREKVLNVFSDEVAALTLRRDGKEIRCEKKDKRWTVVKPENRKVPPDLISALIENLTDKQEAEAINEAPKPEDLEAFGLTTTSSMVEIEMKDGRKMTVKLGARNPPQTAIYAQTSNSPRVLLIGVNIQYYADLLYEAGAKSAAVPDAAAPAV